MWMRSSRLQHLNLQGADKGQMELLGQVVEGRWLVAEVVCTAGVFEESGVTVE